MKMRVRYPRRLVGSIFSVLAGALSVVSIAASAAGEPLLEMKTMDFISEFSDSIRVDNQGRVSTPWKLSEKISSNTTDCGSLIKASELDGGLAFLQALNEGDFCSTTVSVNGVPVRGLPKRVFGSVDVFVSQNISVAIRRETYLIDLTKGEVFFKVGKAEVPFWQNRRGVTVSSDGKRIALSLSGPQARHANLVVSRDGEVLWTDASDDAAVISSDGLKVIGISESPPNTRPSIALRCVELSTSSVLWAKTVSIPVENFSYLKGRVARPALQLISSESGFFAIGLDIWPASAKDSSFQRNREVAELNASRTGLFFVFRENGDVIGRTAPVEGLLKNTYGSYLNSDFFAVSPDRTIGLIRANNHWNRIELNGGAE